MRWALWWLSLMSGPGTEDTQVELQLRTDSELKEFRCSWGRVHAKEERMQQSADGLLSHLNSDSTCVWGNFQKEVVKDPIGLEVTAPSSPTGWTERPLPPTTVENLIIHRITIRVLRKIMANTRGKLTLDQCYSEPTQVSLQASSERTSLSLSTLPPRTQLKGTYRNTKIFILR